MKPLPGPLVVVVTMLAPKIRSVALVVVAEPLLLVALLPVFAAVTSTGLFGSAPLVFKNADIGIGRSSGKRHGNRVGSSRRRRDVLGVVDGLRQVAALTIVGPTARVYTLPFESEPY